MDTALSVHGNSQPLTPCSRPESRTEARTASHDNLSQMALRGCSFPSASLSIVAMTLKFRSFGC
jgi:hypothetical protein